MLAVAHGNLVSLWNPDSLALVQQFVGPTSADITFIRFIEPCLKPVRNEPNKVSLSPLAGSGQAYLVFGSNRGIVMINALTGKMLWTSFGRFSPDNSILCAWSYLCHNSYLNTTRYIDILSSLLQPMGYRYSQRK